MRKTLERSIIVIILVAVSITIGYIADSIYKKNEARNYPLLYEEYVEKYSKEYNVPKDIIYAVIKTESNFKEEAKSSKGAKGLMQIMPSTFEWICSSQGFKYTSEDITDPEINIKCGTFYLSYCYNMFKIWSTAYAAYNAGHGQVRTWLEDEQISENGHLLSIPFPETESYVKKVSNAREKYIEILSEEKQ